MADFQKHMNANVMNEQVEEYKDQDKKKRISNPPYNSQNN